MKTKIILSILAATLMIVSPTIVSAQQDNQEKKEVQSQRKKQKSTEKDKNAEILMQKIENKAFTFYAKYLTVVPKASIPRTTLSGSYVLAVSGNQIKCYLPIYGTTPSAPRPSMESAIDFREDEYTMTTERSKGGMNVTIEAKDSRTNTTYTFKLTIPRSGYNASLRVTTLLDGPTVFSGEVK